MSILTQRRFRIKFILGFGIFAALLSASVWYVSYRGGWRSFVEIQPVLNPSSPRSQNGYTANPEWHCRDHADSTSEY